MLDGPDGHVCQQKGGSGVGKTRQTRNINMEERATWKMQIKRNHNKGFFSRKLADIIKLQVLSDPEGSFDVWL